GNSGTVGDVYDYPASATNDHALVSNSVANGKWRVYGLDPMKTYSIRFWGSQLLSGYRILQIKKVDENIWQEYNAGMSKNYNTAASFSFSGKSDMTFDFRVKAGSVMGHINLVDIVVTRPLDSELIKLAPLAYAGGDSIIAITDSIKLKGKGFDPDGVIAELSWSKLSGPSEYTLSPVQSGEPFFKGNAPGIYHLELKVTDNDGLTGTDTVMITVMPRLNQLPIANAGSDQSLNLPGSVRLNGSGSDTDGNISSYQWRKVTGPTSYTISSNAEAAPDLTNMVSGVYTFELTVTDNEGGTDRDTVAVTINSTNVITQRVLIDLGLGNLMTNSPDQWGKYWNNLTDARTGLRVNNAVTVTNLPTTIKLDVINPTGSLGAYDLNTRTSNSVGSVGDYPATATNDNALAHSSISNGLWKIYGLEPKQHYTIKFWGSMPLSGNRTIQIKMSDETAWKEYNSSLNYDFVTAASFAFTGKSEILFNIRVKPGATYGYINVLDITANGNDTLSVPATKVSGQTQLNVVRNLNSHNLNTDNFTRPNVRVLNAYPNPTNDLINLEINNGYRGPIEIYVYNIYGSVLSKITKSKLTAAVNQRLNLSEYPPGIYIVKIRMGNTHEIIRIDKVNAN
ncbi:MAG: T9SS type A sorting domain-containing protein, partial [Pedobacter sp.]